MMYPDRQLITQGQILQHVMVFISLIWVNYQQFVHNRCVDQGNVFGQLGLGLYMIYLGQFTAFYMRSYNKKLKAV